MLGNYPAGVTGNEYQIAGYDEKTSIDHREASCQNDTCSEFDIVKEREIELSRWFTSGNVVNEYWEYTCPKCGDESEYSKKYEDDGYNG